MPTTIRLPRFNSSASASLTPRPSRRKRTRHARNKVPTIPAGAATSHREEERGGVGEQEPTSRAALPRRILCPEYRSTPSVTLVIAPQSGPTTMAATTRIREFAMMPVFLCVIAPPRLPSATGSQVDPLTVL
ncbi:hypothetical protein [Streptomyces sp. NPDC001401]|uniref:hypothetical protein n=1 Tax=Streptomyces sp. NPDC001401 TaxID=3364570 RepID=UPI003682A2F2